MGGSIDASVQPWRRDQQEPSVVALAQLLILLNTQLAWYDGVTAVMAEFLGHDRRQLFSLLSSWRYRDK